MRATPLLALGLMLACKPETTEPDPVDTGPTTETTPPVPVDCSQALPLPLEFSRISGFTGAEDFAFDLDGNFVSADDFGNVVRISFEGEIDIWSPNFGETAGTAFLPDGKLAIANVSSGRVEKVRNNGSTGTLIAGLSYPNGVAVDFDGRVYVADQNQGVVLRYDEKTDERLELATGLFNPNGLALNSDHTKLYVGSFGGGTIHVIDLTDLEGGAELFAETPTSGTTTTDDPCGGLIAGDECFLDIGIGTCIDDTGALGCELVLDEAACNGLSVGDACQTSALGQPVDSVCYDDGATLFCPRVPGEIITACDGLDEGDGCSALGVDNRDCEYNWEGTLICDTTPFTDVSEEACVGLSSGDDCVIIEYEGYIDGTCAESYWYGTMTCDPGWYGNGYEFAGGLDGVAVDACDNVWVTEYTLGYVWRFGPEGGEAELAVDTNTFWIPNLHWGSGVGGWDANTLYIQDRFSDELLAAPTGIPGAPVALQPEK